MSLYILNWFHSEMIAIFIIVTSLTVALNTHTSHKINENKGAKKDDQFLTVKMVHE